MVSRSPEDPSFDASKVLLEGLQAVISRRDFETWLRPASIRIEAPDRIVVTVPNAFHKRWIEDKLAEPIRAAARGRCAIARPRVDVEVEALASPGGDGAASSARGARADAPARGSDTAPAVSTAGGVPSPFVPLCSPVRADATFERFVVGPANRIAFAACLAVSEREESGALPSGWAADAPLEELRSRPRENDGESIYNPLILYGGTGLGKTHLLHACYQKMRRADGSRPVYLSAIDFANVFLEAAKKGLADRYGRAIRDHDCVVVDDLQFINDKRRTQEALYDILKGFTETRKQVILASREAPKEMAGLSEAFRSLLRMGLVVRLEPPDLETRLRFLKRRLLDLGVELPVHVVERLARQLPAGPRELDSILINLAGKGAADGHGSSLGHALDGAARLSEALEAAEGATPNAAAPRQVSISRIHDVVSRYYNIEVADMLSPSRARTFALARQIGMYLARELTELSLEEIGGHFGGRDHATVIYSVRKVTLQSEARTEVRSILHLLRRSLLDEA